MPCRFTEADLRLYPTIIRYDSVYTTLFRCSRRRVSDYPALARWREDVYNLRVPAAGMQVHMCIWVGGDSAVQIKKFPCTGVPCQASHRTALPVKRQ